MSTGRRPNDARLTTGKVYENTTSLPFKAKSKQREPPPVLFLPPSPGTSHASLPGILAPGAPALGPSNKQGERSSLEGSASLRLGPFVPPDRQRPGRTSRTAERTRGADRTDALWAEMQATLDEVESSASGGTHVFGPGHDGKLAELRAAQIALAQAWARSEADDAMDTALRDDVISAPGDHEPSLKGVSADAPRPGGGDATNPARTTAGTSSVRAENSGADAGRLGAKLEEETELDILLARKRREANDRYFQRVNNGVIDVVAKLEDVAVAMRAVEQESKDVWNENTSPSDGGLV